jgi:hypothetical protein
MISTEVVELTRIVDDEIWLASSSSVGRMSMLSSVNEKIYDTP